MNQLVLRSGKMELLDVPYPALPQGYILVRNYYSLISAGTEGNKIRTARKSYFGKAKEKPEQVAMVLDSVRTEGLLATYRKVKNKLEAAAPVGYSCSGEVIQVAPGVSEFRVGDLVACGGTTAVHAEVVSVPSNLSVHIPVGLRMDYATYTTVGAIALQGIRQADLRLGESCAVIGLGLVGQLTVQLLKAAGIRVVGIDVDVRMVDLSKSSGADLWIKRGDPKLDGLVREFTSGYGVDSVIITAGTSSLDPIELAGKLSRNRGRVVVVGAVPTGFSRETYYKKELELRMSRSYGPGRYEANYEEKGLDYPIGFVRWTENRNMSAFLQLAKDGKLNLDPISTHVFDFCDGVKAYDMMVKKSEPFVGILLKYDLKKSLSPIVHIAEHRPTSAVPRIGFIGAGSFAQKSLLPNIHGDGEPVGICTASGNNSASLGEKFGFQYATGNPEDILADPNINTVFVATRHNLHAGHVLKALSHNKNVFVEKPLCMTPDELEEIRTEYEKRQTRLMVGFNRRFSPYSIRAREMFEGKSPLTIIYRVNAGYIPAEHWTQDPEIGGGRVIGEVCHFVDLASYFAGSPPVLVSAFLIDSSQHVNDTLTINLKFRNGSVANISYLSNGSKYVDKEYIEIHGGGDTAIIKDFKELLANTNRKIRLKKMSQDKGHKDEVCEFLKSIKDGQPAPIPFEQIYSSTLVSFKILESIRSRQTVEIS